MSDDEEGNFFSSQNQRSNGDDATKAASSSYASSTAGGGASANAVAAQALAAAMAGSRKPKPKAKAAQEEQQQQPAWMTDPEDTVDTLLQMITETHARRQAGFFDSEEDVQREIERMQETGLLSNTAIAPLKALIRSEQILRTLLHKFVIARSGRFDSAAERVLNLCQLLETYPHLTLKYDGDIARGLGLDVIRCFPFRQCPKMDGAVMLNFQFAHLDWSKIEVEQMEKTFFFLIMAIVMMPNHAAQRAGVVIQADGREAGLGNVKMSFELFGMRLLSQALPVRVKNMFIYQCPTSIRMFAWPAIRMALPAKIVDRVHFIDDENRHVVVEAVGEGDTVAAMGGPWMPVAVPDSSDLTFIQQWTTDRTSVVLPAELERAANSEEE